MSSLREQVLNELLRILKEELVFSVLPGDTCTPIPPKNIVFRKVSVADRDIDEGKVTENFPMIILSCPEIEPFDPSAGENAHDVYPFSFLAQIIDRDNCDKTKNIGTYWFWQELIPPQLQFRCLQNVDSIQAMALAKSVDAVDERYWLKEKSFKAGVQITVSVWRTRTWV